jgi:hypothetical protein
LIRTIRYYLRESLSPRLAQVIGGAQLGIAITIGVLAAFFGDRTGANNAKLTDLLIAVLTYASVAFGFCLAGLTVTLTLPSADFTKHLANLRKAKQPPTRNAYSDLLFVFSWTAVAHWLVVTGALVMLATRNGDAHVLPAGASCGLRTLTGVFLGVLVYALIQFLITLVTLSQVSDVYIKRLQST